MVQARLQIKNRIDSYANSFRSSVVITREPNSNPTEPLMTQHQEEGTTESVFLCTQHNPTNRAYILVLPNTHQGDERVVISPGA